MFVMYIPKRARRRTVLITFQSSSKKPLETEFSSLYIRYAYVIWRKTYFSISGHLKNKAQNKNPLCICYFPPSQSWAQACLSASTYFYYRVKFMYKVQHSVIPRQEFGGRPCTNYLNPLPAFASKYWRCLPWLGWHLKIRPKSPIGFSYRCTGSVEWTGS